MVKIGKKFTYNDLEYVLLKAHNCGIAQNDLISMDMDLNNSLLFCESFHPWFVSSTCEFRAILKAEFDPQMGLEYYCDQIEDLIFISEIDSKIRNW